METQRVAEKRSGYKIFRNVRGVLRSYIMTGKGACSYPLHRDTVPKPGCGSLAVFNTLLNALHFVNLERKSAAEIWRVEYTPSREGLHQQGEKGMKRNLPTGTRFAGSLRPAWRLCIIRNGQVEFGMYALTAELRNGRRRW